MTPDQPSLNALRAFEAAARCGTFVLAAAELGVTAAAVSQLVRGLEASMGRQVFLRQANRILLTDAGREIYPALETAFREISSIALHADTGRNRKRLILSVLPWLAPWAVSALHDYPLPIEIRAEPDPVALTEGAADLRLTYGAALYPDHRVQTLFADQMVIVQANDGPIADAPRVHVNWGAAYASLPGWSIWSALQRASRPDMTQGHVVNDPHLAFGLVRQGQGTALVPKCIAPPDLHQVAAGLTLPWPYVLVCLNARARNRPLAALMDHLLLRLRPLSDTKGA